MFTVSLNLFCEFTVTIPNLRPTIVPHITCVPLAIVYCHDHMPIYNPLVNPSTFNLSPSANLNLNIKDVFDSC